MLGIPVDGALRRFGDTGGEEVEEVEEEEELQGAWLPPPPASGGQRSREVSIRPPGESLEGKPRT